MRGSIDDQAPSAADASSMIKREIGSLSPRPQARVADARHRLFTLERVGSRWVNGVAHAVGVHFGLLGHRVI